MRQCALWEITRREFVFAVRGLYACLDRLTQIVVLATLLIRRSEGDFRHEICRIRTSYESKNGYTGGIRDKPMLSLKPADK